MSFASFAPTTITPLIAIPPRATIPLPLATATTLRSVAATLVRAPTTPRIISTASRTADRLTAAATLLATARFGRRTLAALVPTLAVATLCLALARFAAGLPLIPATGAPLSPALLPAATAWIAATVRAASVALLLTLAPQLLFTRRRNRRQLKLPLRIDLGHPSRNDIADLNVIVDLFDELFRQSADPDQPGRFGRNLDKGAERRDAGNDADHRVSRP